MTQYLAEAGPFVYPMLLLLGLIAILTVKNSLRLGSAEPVAAEQLRASVDAVLFWGAVAAMLGILGQLTGLYKGFRGLAERGWSEACIEKPMRCLALGLSESLTTVITGLTIFLIAGLLWFAQRHWLRHSTVGS